MSDRPFDFSEFRSGASTGSPGGPPSDDPLRGSGPTLDTAGPGTFMASGASTSDALVTARPPLRLLAAAACLAVAGGTAAALAGGRPWLAVVAWVLAGPVAFALLGAYSTVDTRRQAARGVYVAPAWTTAAYRVVVCLVLVALAAGALRVAEWLGRL